MNQELIIKAKAAKSVEELLELAKIDAVKSVGFPLVAVIARGMMAAICQDGATTRHPRIS